MYNVRPWLGENQLNYVYLGDKHLLAAYIGDKLVYGNTIKVSYKTIKCNFYRGCKYSYWSDTNPAYIGSITYYFSDKSSLFIPKDQDNFERSNIIKTISYVDDLLMVGSTDSKQQFVNGFLRESGNLIDSKDIQIWTTSDKFYLNVEIDQYPKVANDNYAYLMWSNLTDTTATSANDFYKCLKLQGKEIIKNADAFMINCYNVTTCSELNFYGLTNHLALGDLGDHPNPPSSQKNIFIYWNTKGNGGTKEISTFAIIDDPGRGYKANFTNIKITIFYDNNLDAGDVINMPDIIEDGTAIMPMNPYGYYSSKLSSASFAHVFISGNIYYEPYYDSGRYGALCFPQTEYYDVISFSKTELNIEWTVTPPSISSPLN